MSLGGAVSHGKASTVGLCLWGKHSPPARIPIAGEQAISRYMCKASSQVLLLRLEPGVPMFDAPFPQVTWALVAPGPEL